MKKKNWIITGIAVMAVVSFVIIAGFSPDDSRQKENSTCCRQKMKNCDAGSNNNPSGDMLENLSRQFLSISTLVY